MTLQLNHHEKPGFLSQTPLAAQMSHQATVNYSRSLMPDGRRSKACHPHGSPRGLGHVPEDGYLGGAFLELGASFPHLLTPLYPQCGVETTPDLDSGTSSQ